jgi:hypothetical protein
MKRLGWWTGQHAGWVGLGRRLKRVMGSNAELVRGVRESRVKKRNGLFETVQDDREDEIEKREGSNELNLFIECRRLGLRDAHAEDNSVSHPVSRRNPKQA